MIYLLEDDQNIRDFTIYAVESAGYEICGFALPSAFRAAVEEKTPDVVLPMRSPGRLRLLEKE